MFLFKHGEMLVHECEHHTLEANMAAGGGEVAAEKDESKLNI